ncbi:hypothetical protein ACFLWU_06365 [Chloroflexota bacterium]
MALELDVSPTGVAGVESRNNVDINRRKEGFWSLFSTRGDSSVQTRLLAGDK